MKVVFPRNIEKGIMASMSFQIGPLNLSIVQLLVVALGIAAALGIFNGIAKSGGKALGAIVAIPVLIIFIVIGFFKVSELRLIPFLGKKIRNNFFDTTKKFQVNYERINSMQIILKKNMADTGKHAVIERKEEKMNKKDLSDIETEGLY